MIKISHHSLKIIAALVWLTGSFVLFIKAFSLLQEAFTIEHKMIWILFAIFSGLIIGSIKGKFIFSKSCLKNLKRISALKNPKIWQFFRPGFFIFLFLMILTGASLSRFAHGNYPFLIGVAILDLSIAAALLWSSHVFLKHKAIV